MSYKLKLTLIKATLCVITTIILCSISKYVFHYSPNPIETIILFLILDSEED